MARQQAVPAVAPTLQPERAIPILENLISQADSLVTEQSDSTKRQQWAHTGEGAVLAALGNTHPNIQAFGAAQCGVYHPSYDTNPIFANRQTNSLSEWPPF